jgi:serine/threonine-protein kinase
MIGKTIAHYRATVRLGAGGMGEVYRATDSRLGREVALKVLRNDIARDADSLARFEREARLLAGLQHSNIAVIHGFEETDGVRALVMELVEGSTLAERIAQGRIPLEEALPLARQVAEALEYAHERGIIHRDLKPANVKVTPDGVVKVLDFGLAKALTAERPPREATDSPTLSVASTAMGVIMGTAAYMSPEQARGKAVDRRTDIWAFGCLLYEMLSGRRPFAGETVTDTLAIVLQAEPDWSALPATTPQALTQLLRRCLEKDVKRRLQAIGEARLVLEELTQVSASGRLVALDLQAAPPPAALRPGRPRAPLVAGAALGGLLLGGLLVGLLRPAPATAPLTWLALDLAPAEQLADPRPRFSAFALSPDGRKIAFAGTHAGKAALYVRALDRPAATVLGNGGRGQPVLLTRRPMDRLRPRRRAQEGLGRRGPGHDDRRLRVERRGLGRRRLRRVVGRWGPHRRRPLLRRALRSERVRGRAPAPDQGGRARRRGRAPPSPDPSRRPHHPFHAVP